MRTMKRGGKLDINVQKNSVNKPKHMKNQPRSADFIRRTLRRPAVTAAVKAKTSPRPSAAAGSSDATVKVMLNFGVDPAAYNAAG